MLKLNSEVKELRDNYLRLCNRFGTTSKDTRVAKSMFDQVQRALTECVADASTAFCQDCANHEDCAMPCDQLNNFVEYLTEANLYDI